MFHSIGVFESDPLIYKLWVEEERVVVDAAQSTLEMSFKFNI